MNRKAPRGLSLVWVALLCTLALHCTHAAQADAAQVPSGSAMEVAAQVKAVGVRLVNGEITVSVDPIVLKKDQDLLIFVAPSGPMSIQFKDDNNPFGEQAECRGRTCFFRVPASSTGTFPYTIMLRGKTKDPRVEVQP